MRADAERYYAGNRGIATLILGFILPPAAWLLHVGASFALADYVCGSGADWLPHIVTLAALAIALTGGFLAWRNWHDTGEDTNPDQGGTLARSKFLAIAGLAAAAFFSLAILAAEYPNWVLDPCIP